MWRDDALQRAILAARVQLDEQSLGGVPGLGVARSYAIALEHALEASLKRLARHLGDETLEERAAVLLLGGTGRREQALYSDIDIGFVFATEPGEAEGKFIREFLYPLYDLKIHIGHWARTPDQVLHAASTDTHDATSIVGVRHLWGSPRLFADTKRKVNHLLHIEKRDWFLDRIREQVEARHLRDDTVFLLQPHIKDSRGGLRDVQTLGWIAFALGGEYNRALLAKRGLVSASELRRLREAHSFLIELRNAMHRNEGKGWDHFTFERQHAVARELGIEATETTFAEEALMQKWYGHANTIDLLCTRVMRHVGRLLARKAAPRAREGRRHVGMPFVVSQGMLKLPRGTERPFADDPGWMLDYFRVAATEGLELDEKVLQSISARVDEIDDEARRSPLNRRRFMAILESEDRAYQILSEMHRWGVLGAYLPEFKKVQHLPRIDHYHKYAVDEHLLRSVAASEELRDPKTPRGATMVGIVAQNLLRVDLLNFALLMHDVGKWKRSGHVLRGAQMMKVAAERMGFSDREQGILHLLVANHQRMSHLVLRRDPEDPHSAKEIAEAVDEVEHLRMLYVHTACDMMAVSPASWNEWRAAQLFGLFESSLAVLRGRKTAVPASTQVAPLVTTVSEIENALPMNEERREDLENFLADMPERYRRTTSASEIRRHFEMWKTIGESQRVRLQLNPRPGANYSEMTCVASHEPTLFSNLCGAIASRKLNILSAQVYLGYSGACINVFQVQGTADPDSAPDEDVIERLEARLNSVIKGESPAVWKIVEIPGATPRTRDTRPPAVTFDNNRSPRHTLLEIKAPDRPGLLWRIASILERNKVAVTLALISTESYRIVDVFYVNDLEMNKLTSPMVQAKLHAELMAELSGSASTANAT